TATYFSPEQAQGLPLDPRSDLYALGVVLYEMVTGRPPFTGDSPVAIAYKHVQEQPVPPRQIDPEVPVALEAVILRPLATNPGDRGRRRGLAPLPGRTPGGGPRRRGRRRAGRARAADDGGAELRRRRDNRGPRAGHGVRPPAASAHRRIPRRAVRIARRARGAR